MPVRKTIRKVLGINQEERSLIPGEDDDSAHVVSGPSGNSEDATPMGPFGGGKESNSPTSLFLIILYLA